MSTAERTRDLIEAVARAFVASTKGQTIAKENTKEILYQVLSLTCGAVGSKKCETCLLNFFDAESIKGDKYWQNEPIIDKVCKTTCAGVCYCAVDVSQNMFVNFSAKSLIVPPDDEAVTVITKTVAEKLSAKYGPGFQPTREQIIKILTGIDDEKKVPDPQKDLTQIINQFVVAIQIVEIEGPAIVRNVNMEMLIDVVMNAIAENSIKTLQESVSDGIDEIKKNVQAAVSLSLQRILEQFKYEWIGLGCALVLSTLLLMGTYVYKAIKIS